MIFRGVTPPKPLSEREIEYIKVNFVADTQLIILFTGLSVPQDTALLQQLLGCRPGQTLTASGKECVQPLPGNIRIQGHFFPSFQKFRFIKIRWIISKMQPQEIKQSATLNTGKSIKSVLIISTT